MNASDPLLLPELQPYLSSGNNGTQPVRGLIPSRAKRPSARRMRGTVGGAGDTAGRNEETRPQPSRN